MRTALTIAALGLALLLGHAPAGGDDKPFVGPPPPPVAFKVVRTIDVGEKLGPFAFSPDGRVVAVGVGREVHFWDTATGKEIGNAWRAGDFLAQDAGDVGRLAFVDAKTLAVVAALRKVVHLCSYPEGKEIARLDVGKIRYLATLTVAPGMVVVGESGGAPYGLVVWAGPQWNQLWRNELPKEPGGRSPEHPVSVALSPDRSEVAVGTSSGEVRVYRMTDGKLLRSADRDAVRAPQPQVTYAPGGSELAVASGWSQGTRKHDYSVAIWDAGLRAARARPGWDAVPGVGGQARRCFYSPDGKTLFVACADGTVRVYEGETAGLRCLGATPQAVQFFPLTPDGRLTAFWDRKGDNWVLSLCDWRAPTGNRPAPDQGQLDRAWDDLASPDAAKGYRAVVVLGTDPEKATRLLRAKLKPVPVPDAASVKALVRDLDADDFATRERAEKELAKFGDVVEPELREAAKSDNTERRDRAARLLKAVTRRDAPDRLRVLRAVEVLEYLGTPAARDALKAWGDGAPAALLTRDAKAALKRLEAFDPKP